MITELKTFLDIAQYPTPSDVEFIKTNGYAVVGDGGGALYKKVATQPPHIGYGVSATGHFFELLTDSGVIHLNSFGSLGITTDWADALEAAIATLPNNISGNFNAAGTVVFGTGTYNFSRPINVNRQVVFKGAGNPMGSATSATILKFVNPTDGFHINTFNSPNVGDKVADGTKFEGISIFGTRPGTGVGITANARIAIKHCSIRNFGGHGIFITASVPTANANNWLIESVEVIACGGDGLHVLGTDVNAGVCIGFSGRNNDGWAIHDASFLGNYYFGCLADSNLTGSYRTSDLNSLCIFLCCYSEGSAQIQINYPSVHMFGIGGNSGTGTSFKNDGSITKLKGTSSNGKCSVAIGKDNDVAAGLTLWNNDYPSFPFRLKQFAGGLRFDWAALDTMQLLHLYDRSATVANGFSRDVADAAIGFPNGQFVGRGMCLVSESNTIPTTTAGYKAKDIVLSSNPAHAFVGWMLHNGVWKEFGAVTP